MEFFRLRVPHDREEVAAEAAAGGLHEAERGVGGDGSVDRGAAGLQHIEADLRSERVTGGDHAVLREDGRAGGERAAGDAIHLGGGGRGEQGEGEGE